MTACLALGAVCAQAQPKWDASASVLHRQLDEVDAAGGRLVRESGPMLRLQGGVQIPLGASGGALRPQVALAGGTLDYRGQTQEGVPLDSRTTHVDVEAGVAWRPVAPAAWGEGWLVLRMLVQQRDIASTSTASGLLETSGLLMPGVRWSHALQGGGWQWRPAIELRASASHRVNVDFNGAFDTADLKGGRRRDLLLALDAGPVGSRWSFGVAWTRTRQSASPVQALERGGFVVGSVHQPRIEIDDVMLRATRVF